MIKEPTHLGDGVYMLPEESGYGFMLRDNSHRREECTGEVFIEPEVFERMVKAMNVGEEHPWQRT